MYYKYVEFISKNNQHRFKDTNTSNKEAKVYAIPGSSRCIVKLLDKYLEKLPLDVQYMYMRPLDEISNSPTKPWYTKQRVGYNTLKGFIAKLFAASGLKGFHTNHSLRATSITRIFKADVPEKIRTEKSGHKSLKALCMYEHMSPMQEQATGLPILEGGQFSYCDIKADSSQIEVAEKSDKKLYVDASGQEQSSRPDISPLQLHTFSGKLENCTININFNQQ